MKIGFLYDAVFIQLSVIHESLKKVFKCILIFFAYLETLGVLCIISRSANALLGFSASFTILSISYRVQKCKVTKIFASI